MLVLVACEESQEVCKAFRKRGHEAYSCDIQDCSGGHKEWHIKADVIPLINGKCSFSTDDGTIHTIKGKWDIIIAHPPCTYLTTSGNRWFNIERYGEKAIKRIKDREDAIEFFMKFTRADCDKIAIENPIGVISTYYRKPDQIIQPYQFGHSVKKSTCLWLKNLPLLQPTKIVEVGESDEYGFTIGSALQKVKDNNGKVISWNDPRTAKERSKTFHGIAEAMAEQWSKER